jgi:tRNA A37 methylthiotransferase MiaB
MNKSTISIKKSFKSFGFAINGLRIVFQEQNNARCIGEAEEIWKIILEDVLHYRNTSVTDMKNYPNPKKDYLYHNIIITSRGCPFKCTFCYNSCDYVKNAYRNRPIQNVLNEIKSLIIYLIWVTKSLENYLHYQERWG